MQTRWRGKRDRVPTALWLGLVGFALLIAFSFYQPFTQSVERTEQRLFDGIVREASLIQRNQRPGTSNDPRAALLTAMKASDAGPNRKSGVEKGAEVQTGGAADDVAAEEVEDEDLIPRDPLTWGARPFVEPSTYLTDPVGRNPASGTRREVQARIRGHVGSAEYQKRTQQIEAANLTGIIIPAGGSRYTANMLITLKVIREHFLSRLPVEVMWQGAQEMDKKTWSSIESTFAPVSGMDITNTPHPVPGLHRPDLPLTSYTGKVYSLLISKFRHVLMIDADCMPVQTPEAYFGHPQYNASGNLFWPDAWRNLVQDGAYSMHGVQPGVGRALIHAGKGYDPRDTESGQLLVDRAKHLDVLEYLLWINSFPEDLKGLMWGDKDTFGVAFAAAGKAHLYSQVSVSPATLFSWRKDMLLTKATQARSWGWQLFGFLQHDSWGRPAFIHRTINKYTIGEQPWAIELITAPMPSRWAEYYLQHESYGPTRGVPWDYVVPASSVTELTPMRTAEWVYGEGGSLHKDPLPLLATRQDNTGNATAASGSVAGARRSCPVPTFLSIWAMQESGLPIDMDPAMKRACLPALRRLLGPEKYKEYRSKGWLLFPTLRYLDGPHMAAVPNSWSGADAATPLPACRPDFGDAAFDGPFPAAVRAAYAAHGWLQKNAKSFSWRR